MNHVRRDLCGEVLSNGHSYRDRVIVKVVALPRRVIEDALYCDKDLIVEGKLRGQGCSIG